MPLFFEYSIFFPYYFGIKLGLNPCFQSNHIILPNEYPILSASYPQYLPVYPHCLHIFRACPSWGLSLCPRLHRAAKASKGSPEKYWNQDLQCRLIKFGSRERENSETGPELVDFFRHKHYYKVNRDFDGVFMEL